MRSNRLLIGLTLAGLTLAVWLVVRSKQPPHPAREPVVEKPTINAPITAVPPEAESSGPTGSGDPRPPALDAQIESAWRALEAATTSQEAKRLLDALAQQLKDAPPDQAAKAIRGFLNQGRNARTQLGFIVGSRGGLTDAPSFRVWLLDQLGILHPQAAADYADQILATPGDADEWAIAMRNFARVRATPADADFLKAKARVLLNHPPWQQEQSVGWLEAFDVVVHTRAIELTPDLSRLLTRAESSARPAAHAAFLTLDRLVLAEPAATLSILEASPDLLKGRELTRANYFSRADLGDPRQREIVERYLLAPGRSAEELEKFAGLFPNANLMISDNLLTRPESFAGDELAARDREALRVVDEWLVSPRFEPIRPSVKKIRERLADFVAQGQN